MTQDQIDEIALKVLSRREDTCDYSWGEFVESVREVIAEIQRTQEPDAWMYPKENNACLPNQPDALGEMQEMMGGVIPLFTFPPAPVDMKPVAWEVTQRWPTESVMISRLGPHAVSEEDKAEYGLSFSPLYKSAPIVPEGWQLVPKKLTPEMIRAAMQNGFEGEEQHLISDWEVLLAAAPEYKGGE